MESIRYNPGPIAESPEDLRRNLDDELRRIKDWTENYRDDFIVSDSIGVTTGGTPVGTVADIQTLKDGNYYQVPEVGGTPGFAIGFEFKNVQSIKGFVSMIRYTGSATHDVTLGMWNYSTVAYDRFLVIPHTASLDAYRAVFIPDDTNYIEPGGAARMILYHETAGNPSHNVFIDYVALIGRRNARY